MRTLLIVAVLSLSGCNACAGKLAQAGVEAATGVKVDEKNGTATVTTKQGTVKLGGEGQKVPADLPFTAPGDAKVLMSVDAPTGKQVSMSTGAAVKDLSEKIAAELTAKGFKLEKMATNAEATEMVMLTYTKGDLQGTTQVVRDGAADTVETVVTTTWMTKAPEPAPAP